MEGTEEKVTEGCCGRLSHFAKKIDDQLRFYDFRRNRTVGGYLDRFFGIRRHGYEYLALPAPVAAIVVMGVPECSLRLLLSAGVMVMTFFVLAGLGRMSERRNRSVYLEMVLQIAVVLAVVGMVWALGSDKYEKGILLYRHFFAAAAAVVGVALILAGGINVFIWRNIPHRDTYVTALTKTELFISRGTVETPGPVTLIRAFLTVIPGAPLQLLLLPAVMVLIAPAGWLVWMGAGAFLVSYGLLLLGGFDARLNYIWRMLQSRFFHGGALIVSVVIIALAAARLLEISYVTTLFDTAEGIVIALLLFSAYVLFWWYDYWVDRLLAQELIRLLGSPAENGAQVPYAIDPACIKTSVLPGGRVVQVHGASRFIVIGSSSKDENPRFQTHEFEDLFERMAASAFPGGKAKLSPDHIKERILDFKYLTALILAMFCGCAAYLIYSGVQSAQLTVANETQPALQLAELLEDHSRNRDGQPALIIAASGGGTRAALYTASVLEGLSQKGRIQDVVLGSGVSGGGASLAYFAGQRGKLVAGSEQDWNDYFNVMSMPFIQDVVNGAPQWRIVSGMRLGVLLSESFENRWQLDVKRNTLGGVQDVGLILNTAIAGRFTAPMSSASEMPSALPLAEVEKKYRDTLTHTEMAGGRLILTNLALGADFAPSVVETGGPAGLPVVVHDPGTRLEVAAALNANFPPVFSNAAVDIGNRERYWVTDGGAIDNRGIEMSLYALDEALRDPRFLTRPKLPAVTVVVADASAFSGTYSQDRGVGTMMGAGTQYASLLVEEQLRRIRLLYRQKGQPDDFKIIYLPMPLCLRESGSFGTHWMLQPNIEISLGEGNVSKIQGREVIDVLRVMHVPGKTATLSKAAQAVLQKAAGDDRWRKAAKELGLID